MDPAGILILAEVTSKKEATWKTSGFSPPLQSRKYVQTIIPTPQKQEVSSAPCVVTLKHNSYSHHHAKASLSTTI